MTLKSWNLSPAFLFLLLGCGKIEPPPDVREAAEVAKESARRGAEFVEHARDTASDPDKRRDAIEKAKQDLKNPPRQFK